MKRDIPRKEWSGFLEAFSTRHDHWNVTVATELEGTITEKAKDEPLEGLTALLASDEPEVVITVGGSRRDLKRITVDDPRRIAVETDDGVDKAVLIETEAGDVTRIVLGWPDVPEFIDGI